jgi:hypothetical protein
MDEENRDGPVSSVESCYFFLPFFAVPLLVPALLRQYLVSHHLNYISYSEDSGFGGLEVACWPLVPKFAGSHLAEGVGFLGRKKSSARLPSGRK